MKLRINPKDYTVSVFGSEARHGEFYLVNDLDKSVKKINDSQKQSCNHSISSTLLRGTSGRDELSKQCECEY
ncbi:hypothetical protein BpHYR1_013253 [Brachionus plicatilis]|uniref:Uncharacterized protein n=1 Tax=Brachionus plicatilis TaxID=10195 RepID=A0A3M7S0U9_BRAPC|nr:hypothetical protein BpHYR1_013253 [Brachionus plicatilis]